MTDPDRAALLERTRKRIRQRSTQRTRRAVADSAQLRLSQIEKDDEEKVNGKH